MTHLVLFSGGVGSWAAAKRVAAQHGPENMILLFTDTKFEDEDTYRFLREAAENIGAKLEIIADGRDIWQVFKDKRFLANSRVDVCSRILKREMADKWISDHFTPAEVTCYIGIDWSEQHRYDRLWPRKMPYVYRAPLCDPPYLTKAEIHKWAESEGIKRQRLYDIGLPHANCGGGCVKAGQAHWRHLYRMWPERYLLWEQKEQEMYEFLPSAKPFLSITENGVRAFISLRDFRIQFLEQENTCQIDMFDWGGCGCFSDQEDQDE